MEKYQELRDKALKNLKIADHMLTQTYPLVNDPKLLLTVLENLFLALTNSMGSLLHYERLNKRIPPFQDSFESKFNMFKMKLVEKHNIDKEMVYFVGDVKNMIVSHKKSPVEFSRKGVFVMCSEDYKMKVLAPEDLKKNIAKTRQFLDSMNSIISKSEVKI
ncbi:hypothetical protein GF345_02220 [Candidatus Woesearchaeota archaeon]|nr:hypothetical protein [Candidatus Woesearchaeota archaeon]